MLQKLRIKQNRKQKDNIFGQYESWGTVFFFCLIFSTIFFIGIGQTAADSSRASVSVEPFEPPAGLTATPVGYTRIDLSWLTVSNAASYKIYQNSSSGELIIPSTDNSYSDTGLTPNTSYSYTVSSVNIYGGESKRSSPVSATTTPSPLSPEAQKVDVNNDGRIDTYDINILMINWGSTTANNIADFNNDGLVDIYDFNFIMIYWSV